MDELAAITELASSIILPVVADTPRLVKSSVVVGTGVQESAVLTELARSFVLPVVADGFLLESTMLTVRATSPRTLVGTSHSALRRSEFALTMSEIALVTSLAIAILLEELAKLGLVGSVLIITFHY